LANARRGRERPLAANDRRAAGPGARPELARLFDETVRLYLQLNAKATAIYRRGELSGPRRTVLMTIARSGPRTVAQVARDRSEARQRVQPLVNALIAEGLLASTVNPAHKRAPLVALTARGEAFVREIAQHESRLRARLKLTVPKTDLVRAADTLKAVREVLEASESPELPGDGR
jgi:DNA-binding MarR family transcriptional regulator